MTCFLAALILAVAVLAGNGAAARIVILSGVVIENKAPVAGAEVTIGTTTTVTDKGGAFDIDAVGTQIPVTVTIPARPGVTYTGSVDTTVGRVVIDLASLKAVFADSGGGLEVVLGAFPALKDALAALGSAPGTPGLYLVDNGAYGVSAGRQSSRELAAAAVADAQKAGFRGAAVYSAGDLLLKIAANPRDANAPQTVQGALMAALENDNEAVRRSTRVALGNLGQPVVPALLAALAGKSYRTDLGVLVALSRIRDWSAPRDVVARIWTTVQAYNEPVIRGAFDDALRALRLADKLALVGSAPRSVADFQQQVALPADGLAGPLTTQALNEAVMAALQQGTAADTDAKIDIKSWGAAPPSAAWCYQEDRLDPGPNRYSVHCHWSQDRCATAKGGKSAWVNTACTLTAGLDKSGWTPTPKGWMGSWFAFSDKPLGGPFPQLP